MTDRHSFVITLRVVFVTSSLIFIKDAFFKWDGYSFYLTLLDFMPDLSLAFVIWTVIGMLYALLLWLAIIIFSKLIPKSLISSHSEPIFFWLVFLALLFAVKRTVLLNLSISELTGMGRISILLSGILFISAVSWFFGRHLKKFLLWFDSSITPLVWCFVFLFVIAAPFSFFYKGKAEAINLSSGSDVSHTLVNNRPNIILVTWDALTAKDMGLYGYKRDTTPFISEWARDAVVFNRTYAATNWTTPGVMSLMTGQREWTHKIWYRAYYNPVDDYKNNIARIFKEHGYSVYSFVQNRYADPGVLGINNYFQIRDEDRTYFNHAGGWIQKIGGLFGKRYIAKEWIVGSFLEKQFNTFLSSGFTAAFRSEDVYSPFLEFASQSELKKEGQPFFVWLHTHPPHDPYFPPKPFLGTFEDTNKNSSDEVLLKRTVSKGAYLPEQQAGVDRLRERYDEFILYSDDQFRMFVSRLAETIDMSNTIIVFTSDHGESFSHGWQAHDASHLFESFVHIPFILKLPQRDEGITVEMPVGQIDIAPTLLSLAGIPVPEWMDGRSLLDLIMGRPMEPRPVFATKLIRNRSFGKPITKGTAAVWEGDYKLIRYIDDRRSLMYNLKDDPNELNNLYDDLPSGISAHLEELILNNIDMANSRIVQDYKQ